ncbi:hypothetical protein CDD83_10992 [Cordyceps sp. RAO-2017]|nr:hypothetical protein CDD83_10992 [Cordyceps sp. RAO-2017]
MASPQTGSESTPLDRDIQDLRAEVASLRKALKIQCSTILSSSAAVRGMAFSGSPSSDVARQASASTASSRGAHADNNRLGPRPAQQRACATRTRTPSTAATSSACASRS